MISTLSTRDLKRRQTAMRITRCAQVLTEDHGLDGFTMDDLAVRAEVSRRTLFNYYPSKVDAVLGPVPRISEEARHRFVAGQPTGGLLDDLAVLARDFLTGGDLQPGRDDARRAVAVITTTPRLLLTVHQRFEENVLGFVSLVGEREGSQVDPRRARLLVRLLVTVFESAFAAFLDGDERSLADLFDQTLRDARILLA